MHIKLNNRARGLMGVRADGVEPKALLEELNKTFEAFKDARDQELKEINARFEDVVQNEKVDRINKEVGELQASMDAVNELIAAQKVGGNAGSPMTAAQAEHKDAFLRYFRRGENAVPGNRLGELEVKAELSTDSDPDGGFLVPEEMANDIDRILANVSVMRQIAGRITISTGAYKKPVNIGGTTSGWVGERESRTETSTPSIDVLEFPVMEIYAEPHATQTMLDDARINVASWLGNEVQTEFAEEEGAAFITGNGVNKPRGILSYTTIADASWSWGNIGFTVSGVAADINDGSNDGREALTTMLYTLKAGYRSNASWLMNRTVTGKVRNLQNLTSGDYLWQPSTQVGEPATLLGYPHRDDDNMPDVGANAFPIAFGDFRQGYLIVDRFGIRVLRDPYTAKPYVKFYTTKRVGGGVANYEAFKLLKCSA